jgi:diguanylate cyclase (GGDEF)-like protein
LKAPPGVPFAAVSPSSANPRQHARSSGSHTEKAVAVVGRHRAIKASRLRFVRSIRAENRPTWSAPTMSSTGPARQPSRIRLHDRLGAISISARTIVVFALLLSCFAALGLDAYVRMSATADQLAVVRNETLVRQSVVQGLSDDILNTHMKLFRLVTAARNNADDHVLAIFPSEIAEEIGGETTRLRNLNTYSGLDAAEANEVALIASKWRDYAAAVRGILATGTSDPSKATRLISDIDEVFQSITSHLTTLSWMAKTRSATLVTTAADDVDAGGRRLAFGTGIGMLIGLLIAVTFGRSIVRPIRAVTRAMRDVSSGAGDIDLEYRDRTDEIGQMVEAIDTFRRTAHQHADTIAAQGRLIDIAMNNMPAGLSMFDADTRLIVRNERYLDIYRLPHGLIEPGCMFTDVIRILRDHCLGDGDFNSYLADLEEARLSNNVVRRTRILDDGRSIATVSRPLADGGWVATHEDVTERVAAEQRINRLAHFDALTNLPNRTSLRERLEGALARVHRGDILALHYIDLDHFKNVNDTLGHLVGDELLTLVAERLTACVREVDTVARLGGDEFAIIQIGLVEPNDAAVLAQRVQETLRKPYFFDGNQTIIDASIGIAIAPTDGLEVEELFKSADMAAYTAKADGRGTYRFFETEMDQRVKERRHIESGMRRALVEGEFRLHYQPIVNIETNQIASFEALIRWYDPERGLIAPSEFIPIAEECGMIVQIGEWVLRQACRDAAHWPNDVKVAVNLSPLQFNKNLVPLVVGALAAAGLPAERLELEITESVLMQNTFATLATLNQLHELGVKFSMDDFGTGYSSLSYLRSFPFDKIKIDRSFVNDLSHRENSTAIIRAVSLLANSLDMVTTVEGVETNEQLAQVRELGCTEMQGYLYSPPRDIDEITRLFLTPKELGKQDLGKQDLGKQDLKKKAASAA